MGKVNSNTYNTNKIVQNNYGRVRGGQVLREQQRPAGAIGRGHARRRHDDHWCMGGRPPARPHPALTRLASLAAGGEAAALFAKFGAESAVSHVSTGGGACLEFLDRRLLPGVEYLNNAADWFSQAACFASLCTYLLFVFSSIWQECNSCVTRGSTDLIQNFNIRHMCR